MDRHATAIDPVDLTRRTSGLAVHVVVLLGLHLLVQLVLGAGIWTVDEGVYLLQSEWVQDGYWTESVPQSSIGGTASEPVIALPINNGSIVGEDSWIVYGRHPAYPALLATAARIGGSFGAPLVSIIAAVIASLLVGLSVKKNRVMAFWLTALATPLFFHAHVVWGHPLGVAAAALATYGLLRARQTNGPDVLGLAALAAGLVAVSLVRTEGAIFAIATVLVLGLDWLLHDRTLAGMRIGAVAVAGLVGGVVLDTIWRTSVLNGRVTAASAADLSRVSPLGRLSALLTMTLGLGGPPINAVMRMALILLVIVAAIAVRSGQSLPSWGFAVAAAVGVLAAGSATNTGFLVAAPIVTFGLIAGSRGPSDALLLRLVGLYWLGVIATIYDTTAGADYGGRLLLLGLPALVIIASGPIADLLRQYGVLAVAAVAVIVGASVLSSWRTLAVAHDASDAMVTELADFAATHPGAQLVATELRTGRVAWELHPMGLATTKRDGVAAFVADGSVTGTEVWLVGAGIGKTWLSGAIPTGWGSAEVYSGDTVTAIRIAPVAE